MKNYKSIVFFLFVTMQIQAQTSDSLNQEASPIGGINSLAVKYYGIDFSKEQREYLKDIEVEFIFLIDEFGSPTLSEVNGVNNIGIIDSLKSKTEQLQNFKPRIRNGVPKSSIYFMKLEFPTYRMTKKQINYLQGVAYNEAKLSDFEYIEKSGYRLEMLIGGMANQFLGKPSKYLKLGGGMKIDLTFTNKQNYIFGLNMSFYGNKLKKEYPIRTNKAQFEAPPTLLVGAIIGKWYNRLNIQTEISAAVQNITPKEDENDVDWVQFKGWSPGIIVNYSIKLGKESSMYYYGSPSIFENNINLHFGIRYVFLSLKEASGLMMELGLSYRMSMYGVNKYKIKEFLNE